MVIDYSRRSFKVALLVALVGEIFSIVSIATPTWTEEGNKVIGLWTVKDAGDSYSWSKLGAYRGEFYYSTWMNAVRGMMMAGVIMGAFGIIFNIYLMKKRRDEMIHGISLMCYYFLSFAMVIAAVALYTCKIPQGVDASGDYTPYTENVNKFIFRGGYGYSIWFGWVGAGVFLPAAGLAYEGSNIKRAAERLKRYQQ